MSDENATLTGAYVVDALPDTERVQFERHLAHCSDCAREVAELRETVAVLGADAATAPPDTLRDRVLDEITRTRQVPPRPVRRPRRPGRWSARTWGTRLAVAATVVALALAGAFGGVAWQRGQELARTDQVMREYRERGTQMRQLLQAPDARIVHGSAGQANATTVVSRRLDKAMFLGSDLPAPSGERVYQLWITSGDGPTSAGVLPRQEGDRIDAAVVTTLPDRAEGMAVTVEPPGGSPQPTSEPVMSMSLST